MAYTDYLDQVQSIYIAYYGRPADPEGLQYWAERLDAEGGNLDAIIDAFGNSAEADELFGGMSNEATVNTLYNQMFDRDADLAGLEFYVGKLESGEMTLSSIALDIYNGAQNDDAVMLENKLAVANDFTANLDTDVEVDAYAGDTAAGVARDMLATVDANTNPDTFYSVDNTISQIVGGSKVFTLTEIPSQTETTLLVGDNGVPADMVLSFLQDVAKLDLVTLGLINEDGSLSSDVASIKIEDNTDGTAQVIINAGDDFIDEWYDGQLALFTQVIFSSYLDTEETITQTGIVLTTNANNGGSFESGFTTAGDDLIVAGRPELLHGAYIDGGAGYNTLQVDMKGFFAQPFQLLNIQEVQVQNLENVYDVDQTIFADHFNFPISNIDDGDSSNLDLSRAGSLEKLVVTEGPNDGTLNIAGIQNYATARLEGNFTEDVNLYYGRGQGDLLTVELANVSFDGTFSVNQNVGVVHLVSEGAVNTLDDIDFGGNFIELIVSGSGRLSIEDSLQFGFNEATIDASANTGGVYISLASQNGFGALEEITIAGSQARDVFDINSAAQSGVLLNIDTGAGRDTVKINAALSAGAGSVIAGENLTVEVLANADLRKADVSGVDVFVLDADGGLLLLQDQVSELGAGVFVAAHNDIPVLSIEVNQAGTVLSDLIDLSALDSDVKLAFNVKAGASLEMTAQELHTYLAEDGVVGQGTLTITDAGLGFDIDSHPAFGDGVGTVGTIDADGTVIVERAADGFERPVAAPDSDTLIIDTTGTGGVEVGANTISDNDAFSTAATTVIITGDDDITFNVPVEMTATDFTLDFSDLTGALNNLTIRDFQNVEEVIGNGAEGLRIDVVLNGDVGEEAADSGLISSGVEQYVVVDINDTQNDDGDGFTTTASFHLCDNTQGVEVIGLQGNAGSTVTFTNVPWGAVNPTILFEGDGFANWDELSKADGNPDESNVGTIVAEYFFDGAPANVLITNQGVAPGETSTGDARPIVVDGIVVDNAASLNITVEDGNAVISSIDDIGNGAGLDDVTLTSAFDVTLHLDGDDLDSIDATAVDGVATLQIANNTDFSDTELSGIDAVVLADGVEVTMTIDQITAIGTANITVENAGDTATLNVGNYDGSEFDFSALALDDITVATVTFAEGEDITVDPATDFTGVAQLIIPQNTTVVMSADQFKQLVDSGATIATDAAVTPNDEAGALTVDLDGDLTIGADDEFTIAGANVTFEMADGEVLNVEEFTLADGLQVTGDAAAAIKPLVNYLFEDAGAGRFNDTIDVGDYQDVDLRILDALLNNFWIDANLNTTEDAGENSQSIEDLLADLASANILNIYQEEAVVVTLDPRDRVVVVEPNAAPDGIEFSAVGSLADYVRSIDLTLQANADDSAIIGGNITVNDADVEAGFTTLTINVEDVDGAAAAPVEINGDILSDAADAGNAGELTSVVINADADIEINGTLIFNSEGTDPTEATLTLNGAGDITISALDATDVDIDTLNIVNNATGVVNVPGASAATNFNVVPGTSSLVITGTGTELNFGTFDDLIDTPTIDDSNSGIALGDLEIIDASGYVGDLALGIITGTVVESLTITGSEGVTTLTLGAANDDDSVDLIAEAVFAMDATDDVTIDLSGSAAGSQVTITEAAVLPDMTATAAADAGSLTINAETIVIEGNVDFRTLVDVDGNNKLDLSGAEIVLTAGATVQMTDEQFAAFETAGGTITGDGTTLLVDADLDTAIGTDLTTVRGVTELQLVAQDDELGTRQVVNPLTLTFEQAGLTTQYYYEADGDFAVLPVDAAGVFDAVDGDPAAAGDFRAFALNVTVVINGDADISDLQGVDTFDLPDDEAAADLNDVALTARDDQLAALVTTADVDVPADGAGDSGDILAQLSSLTVDVVVDTGNTDIDGNPITVDSSVVFTYNTTDEEWNVTGNAAAIGEAQKTAAFDALLDEAATVTWTAMGSTASMTLEAGATADLEAALGDDTFVFAANVDTDITSTLVITDFNVSGVDILDMSALTGAAGLTDMTGGVAMANDAVFFLGGALAGSADSDLAAATALSAAFTDDTDITESYAVIADDNSTAIYQVSNTASDLNGIVAADLILIGIVDNAALVAADITVA